MKASVPKKRVGHLLLTAFARSLCSGLLRFVARRHLRAPHSVGYEPSQNGSNLAYIRLAGSPALVRTEGRTAYLAKALQAFTYDDDGNLTGDGVWNYAYDAENRLIQMTTTSVAVTAGFPDRLLEFKYDYLGRRVQKRSLDATASTETWRRYLYDGDNLVAEFNAPGGTSCGSVLRSYTWGLDLAGSLGATGGVGALVQITDHATSTSYFAAYDGNGNVAALLDTGGTTVAKYEYSPFGELLRCEGAYAQSNPFRFSTKFTDDESGLVYYGQRYYSPSLGRFINRDPIEEQGGLNLYGFCGNDAVNGTDYLGCVGEEVVTLPPFFVAGTPVGGAPLPGIGIVITAIDMLTGGSISSFFNKLFGWGGKAAPAKMPPLRPKPTLDTRVQPRAMLDPSTNTTRYWLPNGQEVMPVHVMDGTEWAVIQPGYVMDPVVVSASRVPSIVQAAVAALRSAIPALGVASSVARSYLANLSIGGSHYNAANMTFNPAYMAIGGFAEAVSGIGMDPHDYGERLSGWGRARAVGKGIIGTVGAVTAATGATAAGSSLLRTAAQRMAAETTTMTVQRAMSRAELEATQATGLLRGGREGTHFVSDAVNSTATRAQQRLALPTRPEVRVTIEVPSGPFSAPSRVQPLELPGGRVLPGGGMERTATGQIPVRILRVDEL